MARMKYLIEPHKITYIAVMGPDRIYTDPRCMEMMKLLVLGALLSFSLFGQSGLTGSCPNDGAYPNCIGGEVRFTGSNYPAQVHVTVKNSSGEAIDDADYTTNAGTLTFTENLSFADTYTISVNSLVVLTVTTGGELAAIVTGSVDRLAG